MSLAGRIQLDGERLAVPLPELAAALGLKAGADCLSTDDAALFLDTESRCARAADSALIACDGWIGNAHELSSEPAASPSQLLASHYDKHGIEAVLRLRGAFVAAIWLPHHRRLHLLTDHFALRELYYSVAGSRICFGTEIEGVAAASGLRAFDQTWLAEFLLWQNEYAGRSLYRGVSQVGAGTVVTIDAKGVRTRRYWHPEHSPSVRLRRDSDYVDAARQMVTTAVTRCLADGQPAGAHLSGGLDSTLVVATAAPLLAAQARSLTTTTLSNVRGSAWGEDGWHGVYWDEAPRALHFAGQYENVTACEVPMDGGKMYDDLDTIHQAAGGPFGGLFGLGSAREMNVQAARRGVKVMLGGVGGNQTISFTGLPLLGKYFRSGRWGRLAQEVRALRRAGMSLREIGGATVQSAFPAATFRRIRQLAGLPALPPFLENSPLRPEFLQGLPEIPTWQDDQDCHLDWRDSRLSRLSILRRSRLCNVIRLARADSGIDLRFPLLDVDLVEFCLGIPDQQYMRRGETRRLARRLMRGIVPADIVEEQQRANRCVAWHAQTMRARDQIAVELDAMAASPLASAALDIARMRKLMDELPGVRFDRTDVFAPYMMVLHRGLEVGRYICRFERRN